MPSPSEQMESLIEAGEKATQGELTWKRNYEMGGGSELWALSTPESESRRSVVALDMIIWGPMSWDAEYPDKTTPNMDFFTAAANARPSIALAHEIAEAARELMDKWQTGDVDYGPEVDVLNALLARYFGTELQ